MDQKTILIIDDDLMLSQALVDAFATYEYKVVSAQNGTEGLSAYVSYQPHLILVDLMMPTMNGIEFIETLRAEQSNPDIPIVIMTNVADMDIMSEGLALGVQGYIIKTEQTPETIVAMVNQILREHS